MTWDPALFPQDANITITLFPANFPTTGVKKIENAFYTTPDTQPALQGSAWIEVPTSLLNGSAELNATVVLFRQGSELGGPEDARQYVGPEVVLFDPAKGNGTSLASHSNNTSATSGSSGGSTKKLGEEVGIPIGLIFFLALLGVAIFFILRRRKATGGDYLARRKSSRAGSARGAGAGGLVGPHRRTESFHDEPTMGGGVELQSTTRSSRAYSGASSVSRLSEGDSWGWGSPGGGGVSTTVTGGGGNAFREELGRQQTGRGY